MLGVTAFAANGRARRVYERLGYGEDVVSLIKPLIPNAKGERP